MELRFGTAVTRRGSGVRNCSRGSAAPTSTSGTLALWHVPKLPLLLGSRHPGSDSYSATAMLRIYSLDSGPRKETDMPESLRIAVDDLMGTYPARSTLATSPDDTFWLQTILRGK